MLSQFSFLLIGQIRLNQFGTHPSESLFYFVKSYVAYYRLPFGLYCRFGYIQVRK
jgi:hypothetical protein